MENKRIEILNILKKLLISEISLDKANNQLANLLLSTNIKDKNGTIIKFGDKLRFTDKWEWYRHEWSYKFMNKSDEEKEKLILEYNNLPYEERIIKDVQDYEWLLSTEIQIYWEIIK